MLLRCCSGRVRRPGARCGRGAETRRRRRNGDVQRDDGGNRSTAGVDDAEVCRGQLARSGVVQLFHVVVVVVVGHEQFARPPRRHRRRRPRADVVGRRRLLPARHVSIQSVPFHRGPVMKYR